MKIAIEAQRIFRRNKHGMDFVILETIRELQKIDTLNHYRIYVAPGEDRCLEATSNFEIIELDTPTYPLWEQWALPRAVMAWDADLLHCTSNTAPLRIDVPLVVTLHDVIFMEPQASGSMTLYQRAGRMYRRIVVPRIIKRCQQIVTVSHYEKKQIVNTMQIDSSKISVIHNGIGKHFQPTKMQPDTVKRYGLPSNFMFFLGNTDPKKNTPRVIEAYAMYINMCRVLKTTPAHLVVADLSAASLRGMVSQPIWAKVEEFVVTPGYIDNRDLPQIYSAAKIFLYPSLRESFGIPLLEAMACGAPVISSDTSAIPEVAGDAAMLVDPTQSGEIARAMIILEPEVYLRKGFENANKYSWRHSAQQLLKLYTSLKR